MAVSAEIGGEPVPHGILDGYAFVAQRWLMERQTKRVNIELVAYPGMTLVIPTEEEKEKGQPTGMAEAFFWVSSTGICFFKLSMIHDRNEEITLEQRRIYTRLECGCCFARTWCVSVPQEVSESKVITDYLGTNDQSFGIAPGRFGDSLATFIDKMNVISNSPIRHVWVVVSTSALS